MRKKYVFMLGFIASLFLCSCNEEWTTEQYENNVSFVNNNMVNVYIKYSSTGGVINYNIPVILSGSTENKSTFDVSIALDPDTMPNLNFDRFRFRDDLYFTQLDSAFYEFPSMTTTIKAGSNIGYVNMNFKLSGIDMINKYILPLNVVSSTKYGPNPHKHYRKTLMRIIPFNDFSGVYSALPGKIFDRNVSESLQVGLVVSTREARVVDENTIFFFAGVTEEQAFDRAKYKIKAQFNADSTVTLTAEDPSIKFIQKSGSYNIQKRMDDVLPYNEISDLTLSMEYQYDDITNPKFPLKYRFKGDMILEKVKNITIPEEDQQIQIVQE